MKDLVLFSLIVVLLVTCKNPEEQCQKDDAKSW